MEIKRRLVLVMLVIFIVVMVGTLGYYLLYGGTERFIDCMYMTVISLTGVGYGEVIPVTGNTRSQIFTMMMLIFGMGAILYGISALTTLMVEGELQGFIRKKKMKKRIEKLNGHYIVCGGGETGRPLIIELVKNQEQVIVIEKEEANLALCKTIEDLPYIHGDATDDGHLLEAGIPRAAGVLICLPSDKDNLYVTMTARMLNPTVRIITRMTDPKLEAKLKKAGADRVVSPNNIGALRMASEMIRPSVVDFLDHMLRSQKGTLRINQFNITENSTLNGKNIIQSGFKDKYNLLILGVKSDSQNIEFNPPPHYTLKSGMILIIMGDIADLRRAKEVYGCAGFSC
jgi:voltage-gated potassium channel